MHIHVLIIYIFCMFYITLTSTFCILFGFWEPEGLIYYKGYYALHQVYFIRVMASLEKPYFLFQNRGSVTTMASFYGEVVFCNTTLFKVQMEICILRDARLEGDTDFHFPINDVLVSIGLLSFFPPNP